MITMYTLSTEKCIHCNCALRQECQHIVYMKRIHSVYTLYMAKGKNALNEENSKILSVRLPNLLISRIDEIVENGENLNRGYVVRQLAMLGLEAFEAQGGKSLAVPDMEALYYGQSKQPLTPPDDDHIA